MSDGEIARKIDELFDLRPKAIEDRLKLRNPIYQETAAYGHMGREPQTIDGKFQDQELIDQRHMDLVGDTDKSEPFRDPAGILHKKQPQRCQK